MSATRLTLRGLPVALLLALPMAMAVGQTSQFASERSYPNTEAEVKRALQELGAYASARLPMLQGFVNADAMRLEAYERPYYQFNVEVASALGGRTVVHLKSKISAWYTDPQTLQGEYRALPSNGRLETDLLDRLEAYLKNAAKQPTDPAGLERAVDDVRSRRVALEERARQLRAEIEQMNAALRSQATNLNLTTVNHPNTAVFDNPSEQVRILFRADTEDEFEALEQRGDWVRVRLGPSESGWLHRAAVRAVKTEAFDKREGGDPVYASVSQVFAVSREEVDSFTGEWTALKGRKVLFVWARPVGVIPDAVLVRQKLLYAKQVFVDRYRAAVHSGQPFEGVVVIFLDAKGGIAAATVSDIRKWVQGELPEAAFLKRCSLDLPEPSKTAAR